MVKAKIDYTNVTYQEMRDALIRRIPNITDRWTDFNESDIGITLLELFCGIGSFLNYMIDRRFNELFLPNMRERKHGIAFGKAVGYRFNGPTAAKTILRFTIPFAVSSNITIPKHTRCTTRGASPLTVVTMEDAIIPAGRTFVDVIGWQGIDTRPAITLTTNPPYILTSTKVADRSVDVYADGHRWKEVDSFVGCLPTDRVFRTFIDENDATWVEFGDGFEGKIPVPPVDITYIATEAEKGNRGAGFVVRVEDVIYDSNGSVVPLSVTNISELSGGSAAESLYHAKKQLPVEIQANERGVTKRDIQGLVEGFPGVKQCRVLDINDYPLFSYTLGYYEIRVPIVPDNGGLPGQALKEAVYNYLVYDKGVCFPMGLSIVDPVYIVVDVSVGVVKYRSHKDSKIVDDVTLAIQNYIKIAESPYEEERLTGEIDGLVFGQNVEHSRLFRDISALRGVYAIDFLIFTSNGVEYGSGLDSADVPIQVGEIATLGSITVQVVGEV